ncbi:MAG: hypothetical protein Q7R50_00925 [Dehalococcoidales bacterium]|nr:hypothetical protein [Dehalococcoidales bacterium]
MKSAGLQELVRKIFSSEETKSQFVSNPNSIISQFELTETEKKAVFATHARLGLVAGNSMQLSEVVGPLSFWV